MPYLIENCLYNSYTLTLSRRFVVLKVHVSNFIQYYSFNITHEEKVLNFLSKNEGGFSYKL